MRHLLFPAVLLIAAGLPAQSCTWNISATPVQGSVWSMTTGDLSSGARLFIGGSFQFGVAIWDGNQWSVPGSGLTTPPPNPCGGLFNPPCLESRDVHALAVFDDGSGPCLVAGGEFTIAGGVAVSGPARWNGSAWSPMGTLGAVRSLAVFDSGGGPELYAGTWSSGDHRTRTLSTFW